MTRVAVIGAGGYVGGRLVAHLRTAGVDVLPVSRERREWLGQDNVAVDVLGDPAPLEEALAGATAVVHLAGHDEVVAAAEPERALTETIAMTHRIANAARRAGVPRIVYLSTVHVYGAQLRPGAVVTEDEVPQPRSTYAVARLASEHLLETLLAGAAEVVSLRLTNSVGAPADPSVDRWTLLVNDLCRQAAQSGRLVLQTPGLQRRDWVSLADVCRAIGEVCRPENVPAGTYNLASGTTASVREMADLVAQVWADVTGDRPAVEAPSTDERAPIPYRVDIGRLAALGVRLDTPIADAVEETVRFCAGHQAALGRPS